MKKQVSNQKVSVSPNPDFVKKESFLTKWFAPLKSKKPRTDNKFFGFMQRLGGTFMLPIAVMSIAGVLMGIGSGFQTLTQGPVYETVGDKQVLVTAASVGYQILGAISLIGSFFFTLLPLAFTIAIPVGLCSNNAGAAAFAGAISYFGMLAGMDFIVNVLDGTAAYNAIFNTGGVTAETMKLIKPMFGFEKAMDMSILGAIINGIIVWKLNERFQYQKLPAFASFIGGKRLTPVLACVIFPVFGMAMAFIWPWFAKALYFMGIGFSYLGDFGSGIYMFTGRILCPTGLHHMLNALFRFTPVGGVYQILDPATGVTNSFDGITNAWKEYTRLGLEIPHKVASYADGAYIFPLLWGLPAASLAMYLTARKDSRPMVKVALISGLAATIGGGITEPIEFLFLFTAPLLYVFHSFMVGVGYVVFTLFDIRSIQGGDIFNFVIYGPVRGVGNKWWMTFVIGPFDFAIYFTVFYLSIKKFNLKTIGREEAGTVGKSDAAIQNVMGTADLKDRQKTKKTKNQKETPEQLTAQQCLELVGGWDNLEQLTNCFTRLRIRLKDGKEITDAQVKAIGGVALIKQSDKNYQIVIGPQVEIVRHFMEEMKTSVSPDHSLNQ